MRTGHEDILENAANEVDYVLDYVGDLSSIVETKKLRKAWSGILDHYVKALNAMLYATSKGSSKGWADKLRHQQKKDPILQYAFHARHHETHVFEGKRETIPRTTSIGNIASLGGDSNVMFVGCSVIGPDGTKQKLDGMMGTKDGRYAWGTFPKESVLEQEHYIVVEDVKTRGVTYPIPNPATQPDKRALEIAGYLAEWLKTCLHEAKELSTNERR